MTCIVCKGRFNEKPSHAVERRTCSISCRAILLKKTSLGSKNPHWKGGMLDKKCIFCGITFKVILARYEMAKYCSRSCMREYKIKLSSVYIKCNKCHEDILRSDAIYIKSRAYHVECKNKKDSNIRSYPAKIWRCLRCDGIIKRRTKFHKSCRVALVETKCKSCGNIFFQRKRKRMLLCCSVLCYRKNEKLNPNWKGGLRSEHARIRASEEYKNWRKMVFARDNYTCIFCKKVGYTLHADHIKPFSIFPELRLDVANGRTLCKDCHKKTDSYLRKRSRADYA